MAVAEDYLSYKSNYPGIIILYQIGEFLEVFFEDAVMVSNSYGLALSSKGSYENKKIEMCGVPKKSGVNLIEKLLLDSCCVGIIEEDHAAVRLPRELVKRKLTAIYTPGTAILNNFSENRNIITAFCIQENNHFSVCLVDYARQEIFFETVESANFPQFAAACELKEIVIAVKNQIESKIDLNDFPIKFKDDAVKALFKDINDIAYNSFDISNSSNFLENIAIKDLAQGYKKVYGMFISYSKIIIVDFDEKIFKIGKSYYKSHLNLDYGTLRSINLFNDAANKNSAFSLFDHLNKTFTSMGKALLRSNIIRPPVCPQFILRRHEGIRSVSEIIENGKINDEIFLLLANCKDVRKIIAYLNKAVNASVLTLFTACASLETILKILLNCKKYKWHLTFLKDFFVEFNEIDAHHLEILVSNVSKVFSGNAENERIFIKGYSSTIDNLYQTQQELADKIKSLAINYKKNFHLPSLKIDYLNGYGYAIIANPSHDSSFKNNDSIKISFPYKGNIAVITEELSDLTLDQALLSANIQKLQEEETKKIITYLKDNVIIIGKSCAIIAELDVIFSLAICARTYNYIEPHQSSRCNIVLEESFHPLLSDKATRNDFISEERKIHLIFGPNMSGKSTFLKQLAVIMIMAHIGSYVPAKKYHFPLLSNIFSRLGSYDNLYEKKSTFMLEMTDIAAIINNKSSAFSTLCIIDEIGRGTTAEEGRAISQAIIEHLAAKQSCHAVIATHYYELNEVNFSEEIMFYHTCSDQSTTPYKVVQEKTVQKSSGAFKVASEAGLPDSIIKRAEEIYFNNLGSS